MITPEYARILARYNHWQNRSLIEAAHGLSDAQRWQDEGAFFGSIAETLNHILWDDRIWLARLRGDTETAAQIGATHPYTATPRAWDDYVHARTALDDEIIEWADALTAEDLAQSTPWIKGDTPVQTNFGFNLVHMMNHQTHHRGQVHALLTRFGATPQPTDLQMLEGGGVQSDPAA
ncbi:DinB family protein [uncultured Tateyamaria sp.]|uniref:DinB family protein n=1 Tax=uncultured Tateyamaria sp. TaxID=455651 RepID=UPI0026333328|nr:DinB family protein [uncultured Tateyamaria sp.]